MYKLCLETEKSSIFHSKFIYCLLNYEILQKLLFPVPHVLAQGTELWLKDGSIVFSRQVCPSD